MDELYIGDFPFNRRKIEGMVKQWNHARLALTGEWVSEDGDGWYGMRCRAYDTGNPEAILDCIQLEGLVDRIEDPHVRAAVILRMFMFDEQDIGSLLNSRRTGRDLVETGIRLMTRRDV